MNGFDHNNAICDVLCSSEGLNIIGQSCGSPDDHEEEECIFFTAFEDPNNRNGWECKDGSKCVNGFNHNGESCDTLCASTGFNIYGQACEGDEDFDCTFFDRDTDFNKRDGWECDNGSKCINGFDKDGKECDVLCAYGFNKDAESCVDGAQDNDESEKDDDVSEKDEDVSEKDEDVSEKDDESQ